MDELRPVPPERPADLLPGRAMAVDHRRILATALGRLRGKIKYRPVVFELLPPTFTLLQLQRVVEALAGVQLHFQQPSAAGTRSLDDVIGMVHIKDVFAILATGAPQPETIAGLIRQPLYVPQSMGALDLLAQMRSSRTHLAVVLDEYSGTEGLITIEDLVEEIVGEIEDEHDEAPTALLVPIDGGGWDADARAELEDVAETVDPRLGEVEEDVDTLGGLAFVLAGHVPAAGECLTHASGWTLEVTEADSRKVTRLRLHPPKNLAEAEE